MAGLPSVSAASRLRARRWDAVVVGTALPGLVAAVRLGMHGARVLVVDEASGRKAFPGLREPFFVTGAGRDSVLGHCLQALGAALIDRRRLEPQPLAFQVVLPDARVDVGEPTLLASELVSWGLAKPEGARALQRALAECSAAEREAMLASPVVPPGRRLPRGAPRPATGLPGPRPAPSRHARGLPAEATRADGRLGALLEAQVRALSNLGGASPGPEARARLLGIGLEGGADSEGEGLRALLRRRIESLYGEFRSLAGRFRLVSANRQPGVEPEDSNELWLGRALVLNAPHAALAAWIGDGAPAFLASPRATHHRLSLHFQVPAEAAPEGMGPRVVRVGDPLRELVGTNVVCLRQWPPRRPSEPLDLVASAVVPADDPDLAARAAEIEAAVAGLMPFAGERLRRQPTRPAGWDGDEWLADPPAGRAWPAEIEVRVSSRPLLFTLDRTGVAGLGTEGDLLLGWRAGDAIAAELA